jgi:radical SAM protein
VNIPPFDRAPLLVIWETTRSCALACRHCRAAAQPGRDAGELSTEEGRALLDDIAGMGTPIVILSGGDPLQRPDLEQLVAHGKSRGLRMGTIPAATETLTRERLARLRDAGLDQVALSLDGSTAERHDGFRRVAGSFARTLEAAGWARELGLPLQINTCFAKWNLPDLEAMIALVRELGAVFWEVFFLVPVGRGRELGGLSAEDFERVFARMAELEDEAPFVVKLTEAPHYRRFLAHRRREGRGPSRGGGAATRIRGGVRLTPVAVNAGKGFAFVDHRGGIFPSGFLPLSAGSVRRERLSEAYRKSPLFNALRQPPLLTGKCGRCPFAAVCSGSRARAYAVTGDCFAPDPACAYEPPE